jgi:hypothetical protein
MTNFGHLHTFGEIDMKYEAPTKKFIRILKELDFSKEGGIRNGKVRRKRGGSHEFWINKGGVTIKPKLISKYVTLQQVEIIGKILEHNNIIGKREFVHRVMR